MENLTPFLGGFLVVVKIFLLIVVGIFVYTIMVSITLKIYFNERIAHLNNILKNFSDKQPDEKEQKKKNEKEMADFLLKTFLAVSNPPSNKKN